MNNLMKRAMMMVRRFPPPAPIHGIKIPVSLTTALAMMVCALGYAAPIVQNASDGYVNNAGTVVTQPGSGRLWLGKSGWVYHAVYKWDITGITAPVTSAEMKFWSDINSFDATGNVIISSFVTASAGAVVVSDYGAAATASQTAFVNTANTPVGNVTIDVKDYLNAAINANQSTFSLRLDVDSLINGGGSGIIYLNCAYSGVPTTLTYTIPEPATLMLLGLGALAVIPRRRRPAP